METELVQEIADDRWRIKHATALMNNTFALGMTRRDTITANHPEWRAARPRERGVIRPRVYDRRRWRRLDQIERSADRNHEPARSGARCARGGRDEDR